MKKLHKHGKRYAPLSLSEVIAASIITGFPKFPQMPDDNVFRLKAELTRLKKGDLLKMVLNQKKKIVCWAGCVLFFWSTGAFFFALQNFETRVPGRKAKGGFWSTGPE
jgi:hypothetical protein